MIIIDLIQVNSGNVQRCPDKCRNIQRFSLLVLATKVDISWDKELLRLYNNYYIRSNRSSRRSNLIKANPNTVATKTTTKASRTLPFTNKMVAERVKALINKV